MAAKIIQSHMMISIIGTSPGVFEAINSVKAV
jgi:hypothetical protein